VENTGLLATLIRYKTTGYGYIMAWKNLKQRSLADDLVSEHKALTVLDDVNDLMDWQAIEDILRDIHAKRRGNSAIVPPSTKPLYINDLTTCTIATNAQIKATRAFAGAYAG
jgi:hypothetical protein